MGDKVTNLDKDDIPQLETTLVMGLGVAQAPDCTITQSLMITDPFLGLRTLPVPTNVSSRSFRLVAHLSGGTTGSGGGLSLDILDEDLPQLVTETIISEFVESAD